MAQRVDYSVTQNPMTKVLLDDGTEIRIQLTVMNIERTGEKLPDGQWAHNFNIQTVVQQLAPEGEIDVKKLIGGNK